MEEVAGAHRHVAGRGDLRNLLLGVQEHHQLRGRVRSDVWVLRTAVLFALEADSGPVDHAEGGGLGAGGAGTHPDGGHHALEYLPFLMWFAVFVPSNKRGLLFFDQAERRSVRREQSERRLRVALHDVVAIFRRLAENVVHQVDLRVQNGFQIALRAFEKAVEQKHGGTTHQNGFGLLLEEQNASTVTQQFLQSETRRENEQE